MSEVILLSSFHKEIGKCNSFALYNIISALQPDVIFEELPEDIFSFIYSKHGNPQTVEAITIKEYLKHRPILHFPVDTVEMDIDNMFGSYDLIFNNSSEYAALFKQNIKTISELGYAYLNSDKCMTEIEKIQNLELRVLQEMNNPELYNQFLYTSEIDDIREKEMLNNIYEISRLHEYNRGLFICGSQHRKPLIEKIKFYNNANKKDLNWRFYSEDL